MFYGETFEIRLARFLFFVMWRTLFSSFFIMAGAVVILFYRFLSSMASLFDY